MIRALAAQRIAAVDVNESDARASLAQALTSLEKTMRHDQWQRNHEHNRRTFGALLGYPNTEARMADALQALLDLSEAESERQAERDRQADNRERQGDRRERWMLRLTIVAVMLAVPATGPTLAKWAGALVESL
jgi:hypothetical protein